MHATKAVWAAVLACLIAGLTSAQMVVHNDLALQILTITLAAASPLTVYAASNTKTSTPEVRPLNTPDQP
jgi:hypothetical protein